MQYQRFGLSHLGRALLNQGFAAKPTSTHNIACKPLPYVFAPLGLLTHVCGQSDIIIDYATARRREEPISMAVTESTVQWLLHRRMNAQQQMRWSPRGAHLMLKVRCAVMNSTLEHDHAVADRRANRPFRRAA